MWENCVHILNIVGSGVWCCLASNYEVCVGLSNSSGSIDQGLFGHSAINLLFFKKKAVLTWY